MEVFLNDRQKISNDDWAPGDSTIIQDNIFNILEILEAISFHKDSNFYYSSLGFNNLLKNLYTLDEIDDYSFTNPINQIRVMMFGINGINWEISQKQKDNIDYYYQLDGGATTYHINNTSLSEACEYQYDGYNVVVLNLLSSEFNSVNTIHINRSTHVHPPEMVMIALSTVNLKSKLVDAIKNRRSVRNFNLIPKHGENGSNTVSNGNEVVSPLECSRYEAQILLQDAVSYKIKSELYAIDKSRNRFVVFKSDGNVPQNSYHGYYPIDQSEVPDSVQRFLRKN